MAFGRAATLRRLRQAVKVRLSYELARRKWAWIPPDYPLFLGVEPTTACNLRCPHCISGLGAFTRPTGRLVSEHLEQWLDELQARLWGVLFYFQGEPLLHPEIGRLILLSSRYKLFTSLSTNAHFLTEEKCYELIASGLTHLRISIDGLTQQSYAHYRIEGQLETVLDGLSRLLRRRQAFGGPFPLIELQMIVFRHNVHEAETFLSWARKLGVDAARLKTAQVLEPTSEAIKQWIAPAASRYQQAPDGGITAGAVPNFCWRLWRAAEITWDGRVLPCCFDKNANHTFGEMKAGQPFRVAWHSPLAQRFRRQVFTDRRQIAICRNCSEGAKVWL